VGVGAAGVDVRGGSGGGAGVRKPIVGEGRIRAREGEVRAKKERWRVWNCSAGIWIPEKRRLCAEEHSGSPRGVESWPLVRRQNTSSHSL